MDMMQNESERLTQQIRDKLLKVIQKINGGDVLQYNGGYKHVSCARVGPREGEEGLWEGEQKILSAVVKDQHCRHVMLEITLLAAGFIVGSKGVSVTKIWHKTGASIRSYSSKSTQRTTRIFNIQGTHFQVLQTISIIVEAVDRYKELVDGKYADQVVESLQEIQGITFEYCPPPIEANPLSARTLQFPGKPSEYGLQRRRQRQSLRSSTTDSPQNNYFQEIDYASPIMAPLQSARSSYSQPASDYPQMVNATPLNAAPHTYYVGEPASCVGPQSYYTSQYVLCNYSPCQAMDTNIPYSYQSPTIQPSSVPCSTQYRFTPSSSSSSQAIVYPQFASYSPFQTNLEQSNRTQFYVQYQASQCPCNVCLSMGSGAQQAASY
eukprot:TRINITY_DN4384_c0_g1_i1.p1 TRINITY_DN4384_c0_g1~~TRINITY_DN4384_c0_g1_i1.p1  ORF type:complete len:379 (+),score=15.00 TRINITY_DN4384_c0_g1_i1:295-1431(+)